jgi:hypothetical protein
VPAVCRLVRPHPGPMQMLEPGKHFPGAQHGLGIPPGAGIHVWPTGTQDCACAARGATMVATVGTTTAAAASRWSVCRRVTPLASGRPVRTSASRWARPSSSSASRTASSFQRPSGIGASAPAISAGVRWPSHSRHTAAAAWLRQCVRCRATSWTRTSSGSALITRPSVRARGRSIAVAMSPPQMPRRARPPSGRLHLSHVISRLARAARTCQARAFLQMADSQTRLTALGSHVRGSPLGSATSSTPAVPGAFWISHVRVCWRCRLRGVIDGTGLPHITCLRAGLEREAIVRVFEALE